MMRDTKITSLVFFVTLIVMTPDVIQCTTSFFPVYLFFFVVLLCLLFISM
jgi:hypothetical protein